MAPGWKATTDETGAYELIPASYEYRYQEVYVEIPRTAESPGLGVLLEQFGTLDAENGGLTLVAGLVEGGNAANAGLLAARIVGVVDPAVREAMERYQDNMERTVLVKAEALNEEGYSDYLEKRGM